MTIQSVRFPTLISELWDTSGWIKQAVLVLTGIVLLTISAKIKVPLPPVPITMQTFVVFGLGMVYGWKLGASTVLLYLIVGATGLPVFAGTPEKGIGVAYMMGPTGGYLLGFVIAAAATGFFAEKGWDRKAVSTFLAMFIGNVIIYVPGLIWLGNVVGWDKPVLEWGMTPFLIGDIAKIILAMLVLPLAWKLVKKSNES